MVINRSFRNSLLNVLISASKKTIVLWDFTLVSVVRLPLGGSGSLTFNRNYFRRPIAVQQSEHFLIEPKITETLNNPLENIDEH